MYQDLSRRRFRCRNMLVAAAVSGLAMWSAGQAVGDDPPDGSNATPLREIDDGAHGGLGLTYVSSPRGVMVAEVREDGPADQAGIREGDRIVSIGGNRIRSAQDAVSRAGGLASGTEVLVTIERGEKLLEAAVTLDETPDAVRRRDDDDAGDTDDDQPTEFRASRSVPREVNLGWKLDTTAEGVHIERLEAGSPAAKAALEEGDIIVQIAGENVLTPEAVSRALNQLDAESQVEVTVKREGEEISFLLKLPGDHERDLTQGGAQETTRQRIDFDPQFRESDYEQADERRLMIEILRELRYQRGLLESIASGTPTNAAPPSAGVIVPGSPATQQPPEEEQVQSPADELPDDDRGRTQRRRRTPEPPPVYQPLEPGSAPGSGSTQTPSPSGSRP